MNINERDLRQQSGSFNFVLADPYLVGTKQKIVPANCLTPRPRVEKGLQTADLRTWYNASYF